MKWLGGRGFVGFLRAPNVDRFRKECPDMTDSFRRRYRKTFGFALPVAGFQNADLVVGQQVKRALRVSWGRESL